MIDETVPRLCATRDEPCRRGHTQSQVSMLSCRRARPFPASRHAREPAIRVQDDPDLARFDAQSRA